MAAKLVQAALVIVLAVGLCWLLWPRPAAMPPGTGSDPVSGTPAASPVDASVAAMPTPPDLQRDTPPPMPVDEAAAAVTGSLHVWPSTPVAGASVRLFASPTSIDGDPLAETASDDAGRFRFPVAPAWQPPFVLVVSAESHTRETQPGVEPGQEVSIRLWQVVPLFGRVYSAVDDEPLVGARVSDGRSEALTDASGNYELLARCMRDQTYLTASHEGFADHSDSVLLHDRRRTQLDIPLQPTVTVRVEVVDAISEAPVADVEVRSNRHRPAVAKGDAGGTVLLPIADGQEVSLQFSAPDYCPVTWTWHASELGGRRLRMPLTRGVQLAGQVTDASAAPVTDASIRISYPERPFGNIELAPTADRFDLPGTLHFERRELYTKSGDDGRFRQLLMPCALAFHVQASHRDFMATESAVLVADAPGARVTVDLQLARGGSIAGRVRCNDSPRQGQVLWRPTATDAVGGSTQIDPKGEYELPHVAPGAIELIVREQITGRVVQTRTVQVVADQRHRVDFEWHEETASITGRITSSSGAPMAGLAVIATSNHEVGWQLARATTDDDGRYSLEVRPPALFTIRVMRDGIVRERSGVAAGASDVDFVWPDTGVLRLRLIDATTQQPITPVGNGLWSVAFRESGDDAFRTVRDRLDHTGLLQLTAPVGNVDVSLHLHENGYAPKIAIGLPVTGRDEAEEIRVELTRGVAVELRLQREDAFPAARKDHLLFLLEQSQLQNLRGPFPHQGGPSNHRIGGINMWVGDPGLLQQMPHFDAAGTAQFEGMQPGRYRLVAFPDDLTFEPAEFVVGRADNTITLDWRKQP